MSVPADQLQYVWHAARYIAMRSKFAAATAESAEDAASRASALDVELAQLRSLRATILEKLPEEQVGAVLCAGTQRVCRLVGMQEAGRQQQHDNAPGI
jgi:hypothetical protein